MGIPIPGVIGVFLIRITPARDVPPAYLVMDDAQHPAQALRLYIDEMQLWVDAVRGGQPTTDLIPVTAPATVNYADMLASRLAFLRDRVLSDYA